MMRLTGTVGLLSVAVVCYGTSPAWAQDAPARPDSPAAGDAEGEGPAPESPAPDDAAASPSAPDGAAASPSAPDGAAASPSAPDDAAASPSAPDDAAASPSTPDDAAASPSTPIGVDASDTESFPGVPETAPKPVTHVEWNPRWRKAGFWDAVTVSVGSIVIIGDTQLDIGGGSAKWSGPILWDDSVRDALRFETSGGRSTAATVSDVMMMGSLIHNVLFDNLAVAWVIHGEPQLAWQMSVMNAEAYAIALSLTALVKSTSSRARPLVQECDADPEYSSDCKSLSRFRSFFSGHASTTAVGAGLLCAHHLNVPLYDGGLLDVGTCVMGIGLTLATGALRIASDKHWATDVTTGHLVGFASGFLVPTLLYYNERGDDREDGAATSSDASASRALLLPAVGQDQIGVQLVGLFP